MHDNENLTTDRPTFVTHLECSMTGEHYPADQLHNLSRAGKPLLVRYDLDGVRRALNEPVGNRPSSLTRISAAPSLSASLRMATIGVTASPRLTMSWVRRTGSSSR